MSKEPTYNITFAIEPASDALRNELEPLFEANHIEVDQEDYDLDPNYQMYFDLYELGLLRVLTVRDEGDLVGYSLVIINENIRESGSKIGQIDIVYLLEPYRRYDVAKRFFQFIHKVMMQNGLASYKIGFKRDVHDLSKFLKRLDYYEQEVIYRRNV